MSVLVHFRSYYLFTSMHARLAGYHAGAVSLELPKYSLYHWECVKSQEWISLADMVLSLNIITKTRPYLPLRF